MLNQLKQDLLTDDMQQIKSLGIDEKLGLFKMNEFIHLLSEIKLIELLTNVYKLKPGDDNNKHSLLEQTKHGFANEVACKLDEGQVTDLYTHLQTANKLLDEPLLALIEKTFREVGIPVKAEPEEKSALLLADKLLKCLIVIMSL